MTRRRRRSDRSGRAPLFSPGRPVVAGRDERRRFWAAIAAGMASEDAAVQVGMSQAVGTRLFREAGGKPPAMFRPSAKPLSGRCSLHLRSGKRSHFFACKAAPCGRLGADSDEQLQRFRGSCGATLRPEAAAWSIARRQRNGMPSDLLAAQSRPSLRSMRHCEPMWRNDWQASSSLRVGLLFPARLYRWKGRRHGPRKHRRWANAWSPEQIACRLPVDFPDDETMRISHEAVYQALFVQSRGALRRELTGCLRTGRVLRTPRARTRGRGKTFISPEIMISRRPAEAADRAVPGHWEGDLILGLGSSAIGTLVERMTRFILLLHLPRMMDHGHEARVKNGPALAGHGAEAVARCYYANDYHLA